MCKWHLSAMIVTCMHLLLVQQLVVAFVRGPSVPGFHGFLPRTNLVRRLSLLQGGGSHGMPAEDDPPKTARTELQQPEDEEEDDDEPFPMWDGVIAFEDGEADAPPAGVIVVDGFCDYLGKRCAQVLEEAGYAVVQVMSDHVLSVVMKDEGAEIFRAPKPGAEASWAAHLPFPVVGVLCESDAGLATAERLQAALLGPRYGGVNEARRDKFLMNEAIREAGLEAVRQVKTGDWAEVQSFLASLKKSSRGESSTSGEPGTNGGIARDNETTPAIGTVTSRDPVHNGASTTDAVVGGEGPGDSVGNESALDDVLCVVKPARGCASGSVFRCRGEREAEIAFRKILGTPKYGTPGAVNDEVVVQEFLQGTEYVVDTVSRDGNHKVMAIWRYDKRPVNGAPFVYFSTQLMRSDGEDEQKVIEYAIAALDALNFKFGPTHTEVMMVEARPGDSKSGTPCKGTPMLVEVNTRWHLTDFAPVTNACVGYNAVDETLSAYLNPERFDALARDPPIGAGTKHGRVVHLVSYVEGPLKEIKHQEEIQSLESFIGIDVYPDPERGGTGWVKRTIDIRSDAGWVHLVHENPDVVERDFQRVVEFMPTMYRVGDVQYSSGGSSTSLPRDDEA